MIVKIRAYKNTGLAFGNCLDDSSLLDSIGFNYIDIPDVALKQTRGIVNIKLAITWDDAKDIDYIKIDNSCYWVLGLTMLNDNVASVSIMYDAITSIGIKNITFINGWCTRRTLSETEDDLYNNIIDEPFTPSEPLTSLIFQAFPEGGIDESPVVLSTVDLSRASEFFTDALVFEGTKETGGDTFGVAVPKLPTLKTSTGYLMNDMTELPVSLLKNNTQVAGTALFDLTDDKVLQTLNYVYSISADNTILDSYMLPNSYFELVVNEGLITGVNQLIKVYTSKLSELITNLMSTRKYANKKVFSGQFMQIQVTSIGSGNSASYRPEDIIPLNKDLNTAGYYIIPDGRYNGVPTLIPNFFRYSPNIGGKMFGAITGAEWQRAPFTTSKNGIGAQRITYNTGRYIKDFQQGLGIASSVINGASELGSAKINQIQMSELMKGMDLPYQSELDALNLGSKGFNAINSVLGNLSNMALYQNQAGVNRQMLRVQDSAKDMHFLNAPGLISYFGNTFMEVITGLSSKDMDRFDTFLTAFGYAVNEQLTPGMFNKNSYFDYIQASDLNIKGYFDNNIKNNIIQALNNGIRLWHKQPIPIIANINRVEEV